VFSIICVESNLPASIAKSSFSFAVYSSELNFLSNSSNLSVTSLLNMISALSTSAY
jgi:hypothetical protein